MIMKSNVKYKIISENIMKYKEEPIIISLSAGMTEPADFPHSTFIAKREVQRNSVNFFVY